METLEAPTVFVTGHGMADSEGEAAGRLRLRSSTAGEQSPGRRHTASKISRSPSRLKEVDASSDDEVGNESASSTTSFKANGEHSSKKHKEKKDRKKKKAKSLAQSTDSVGRISPQRKEPKRHSSKSEEEDYRADKPIKRDNISKVKSPKKHHSSSEDDEDDRKQKSRRHTSTKKSKKHKKSLKPQKRDASDSSNDSDEDSSESNSNQDSESENDRRRRRAPSRKGRKAHREKNHGSHKGDRSSEESSEEEHREKRKSRRSSRSSSRGNSQERGKHNVIRRRSPRTPDPSASDEGEPSDVLSPKEEEIGRMHKELEALKNLTKILEEKLEHLEHVPEEEERASTPKSLTSSAKQLTRSQQNMNQRQNRQCGRTKKDKASKRAIYACNLRYVAFICPIDPTETLIPSLAASKYAASGERISRSTADLTKLRREQLRNKESKQSMSDTETESSARSDEENKDEGDRKLRKSISLTELRNAADAAVSDIKRAHDIEKKVMQKRAKRERARSKREADRQTDAPESSRRGRTVAATNIAPFGNTPATKALECYSCLMKTDISADGDRKLWKRRVLGLGTNGMHLIKPYTEKTERLWPWSTIQQWIINDEQNLIKFMIEEGFISGESDESSSEEEYEHHAHKEHHTHGHGHEHASDHDKADCRIAVYTFRVEDVNKVNDSLWKVVKRVQKKRRGGLEKLGWDKSSTNSSARDSGDESTSSEEEHHHFKESMQSFFKALTHSLSHKSDHKSDHHHKTPDTDHKDRK